jgi:hypothetical protein
MRQKPSPVSRTSRASNSAKVRPALEAAGVKFIDAGIRMVQVCGSGAPKRSREGDGACEHVGDGAFGNIQTEQTVQHLGQAGVAHHLAAVQIRDERDDAGPNGEPGGMSAGGLAVTVFPQQSQSPLCRLIRVVVGDVSFDLCDWTCTFAQIVAIEEIHRALATSRRKNRGFPGEALRLPDHPTRGGKEIGIGLVQLSFALGPLGSRGAANLHDTMLHTRAAVAQLVPHLAGQFW